VSVQQKPEEKGSSIWKTDRLPSAEAEMNMPLAATLD
jgi:hypothetical protein